MRYQQLLDHLAQAQQALGDESSATQTLLRLIEADPLREQSYRALMLAYARQGDRAAALRVYARCKQRLASELGVPPDPETTALQQQLAAPAPESQQADLARAVRLLQAGHYDDALAACGAAETLAVNTNTRQAIVLLRAEIALARGDAEAARRLIQTVSLIIDTQGFESGRNAGWTEIDNFNYALISSGNAQTGNWKAWLVGVNNNTSEIVQNYAVPAAGGTLLYGYKITSTDSCGRDFGYVQVNTTAIKTYNLCSSNATNGYVQGSVSLSAYAGQTVTIKFRATTDASLSSSFYIDNVGFSAGAFAEEVDPYALVGEVAPEPKADSPQGESEEKSFLRQLFLPFISN